MSMFSKAVRRQTINIPAPTLTEKNLPSQAGRVFIVTGGYAGVGYQLSQILYRAGGTIFVAGRSEAKAKTAISSIKAAVDKSPSTKGQLRFLFLDLNDLSTIPKSAQDFLAQSNRLDVLVNNAGVMFPPDGSKTAQGHDVQFGTNCLGPFLFTRLLIPMLHETVKSSPKDSIRILWASSLGIHNWSPPGPGIMYDSTGSSPKIYSTSQTNYGQTKVGNLFLAHAFQSKLDDIVSVSFNPGNLKTELQRHMPAPVQVIMGALVLHPAIFGAYTELWAGWSPEVTVQKRIKYVIPWGQIGDDLIRKDIAAGIEKGEAERFWKWCEQETSKYS